MPIDLDIHPDDLLHRARLGRALSRDEQIYLDAHLRICSTCRFIRDAGGAFDDEAAGTPPAQLDALVNLTMQRLHASPERPRRRRPHRLAAVALTVVAMIGGVAFGSYWGHRRALPESKPSAACPVPPPQPARRAAPVAAREIVAPPVVEPPVVAPPVVNRRRLALVRTPADVETPARLFEVANRARRQGEIAAAEKAYAALWDKFPASREALAARAIAGQWRLDRGQARAAIGLFRQYLTAAPDGDLEEDVLVGLADAHERIGETSAAVTIWWRLLAEHPGSVHAARARAGLARAQAGTTP
jgi:tetratricopeptide (TPR) repeat protein